MHAYAFSFLSYTHLSSYTQAHDSLENTVWFAKYVHTNHYSSFATQCCELSSDYYIIPCHYIMHLSHDMHMLDES